MIVGLEASTEGEMLYGHLGFEMLGRFEQRFRGEEVDEMAFMMWTPPAEVVEGRKEI